MDFAAAGLLDGLDGEERKAREQLLRQLAADGVKLQEMKAAVAEDRLALLPVERVLGGQYTAREIEQRTGVSAALMLRIRRLLGLPEAGLDDRAFGDADVEAARSMRVFLEAGLADESIVEITRVLGEAMSRLAATTTAAFVNAFLKPGDGEHEVAARFAALAELLAPALSPVFTAAYNAHLRESVGRGILGRAELQAGQFPGSQEIAVCFADLVGFTRLGGELEIQELGGVVSRFAELAAEVVAPPVRLVKTIGDAAMFVSPEPSPLVGVALSLVQAAEDADLPSLRAGLASGPAVLRAGDFYGHSVNLSSRVTGIARPGSVLCTEKVHDASTEDFDWTFAGARRLKGIADPVKLYRARQRPAPGPEDSDTDEAKRERYSRAVTKPRADRPRRRASR
jgi:adenylate cyclase